MGALHEQESALRASLQAEYGIRLLRHGGGRTEPPRTPIELAELVVHLPPGSALWMATGGGSALTTEAMLLREAIYRLEVLDWHAHDPKNPKRPERIPLPKPAHEVADETLAVSAKAAAWQQRQDRRQRGV